MIDDPLPRDWRELQSGVCRLFNEVGLTARTEVTLTTPRGTVTVDVHAVDERSVDRIAYIVECKNWGVTIPQSVVHAFFTVMQETGANIGFLVSKFGLQSGAFRYIENTNIVGLTYEQLQVRYLPMWWKSFFCPRLGAASDDLLQYVEPINSRRERFAAQLSASALVRLKSLQARYSTFGTFTAMMSLGDNFPRYAMDSPLNPEQYKDLLVHGLGEEFRFDAVFFRPLLDEMISRVRAITDEFHSLFGDNIFK